MSDIQPYSAAPLARPTRRTTRLISRYQDAAQVQLARNEIRTDLARANVAQLTIVTGDAMRSATAVAQGREQLEAQCPSAAMSLRFLEGAHALALAGIVSNLAWELQR